MKLGLLAVGIIWSACGCSESVWPLPNAPSTDLQVTKAVSTSLPAQGATDTFTVTVRNNGPIAATQVLAGDTLPTGLSYVSHTASVGAYAPTTGLWTIGTLAVGGQAVLTLVAQTGSSTAGSTLTNRAGVLSTAQNDSVPANNIAAVAVTVGPPPVLNVDLQVTKTASTSGPAQGATDTFTVTVKNNGPIAASQVVAGDTLPSGLTYVSHSASVGTYVPTTGVWTIGTLAVSGQAVLTLVAQTGAGTAGTTITNRAGVLTTAQHDSVPANNTAAVAVTVGPPPVLNVDLQATKTANTTMPAEGATVTYTVTIKNNGPVGATSVLAGDTLPAGLTYVSHSATVGTYAPATGLWTVGTLAVAGQAVLTLVAQTGAGTAGTTITNRAGVLTTAQNDSVPANNTAAVAVTVGPPTVLNVDLQATKTANTTVPAEGTTVTFTVTIKNNGPVGATSLLAGDTLPVGLTYVSHSASVGTYAPATGLWTIGNLAVAGQAVLTLVAQTGAGTAGSTITNRAGVLTTAQNDSVPANNTAQVAVTVGTVPPAVVFASDWNTATGSSDSAISDGGKFNVNFCYPSRNGVLSVVPGTSLGWTKTANVARVQMQGPTGCGQMQKENAVPASTTFWGRFYFRNDESANLNSHPVTLNCCGSIQSVPWGRLGQAGGVWIFAGVGATYPRDKFFAGVTGVGRSLLSNGTWYRYEFEYEYVTANTIRFYPRIYDMAGVLLYDYATFFQNDYPLSGSYSLKTWYDAGNAFPVNDVALARNFSMGNEGPGGSTSTLGYWYYANVALSTTGWIGP